MQRKKFTVCFLIAALCIVASARTAFAAETGLESTMEMDFNAIAAIDGIRVVAAKDIPGNSYTEDYGPSQVLEIIRANQAPITVGRLMTSCSCLKATMEKREFAQGERAIIEVRNVKPTQPSGATYLLFVRLNNPYKATLQYEMFVKSEKGKDGMPIAATVRAEVPVMPVAPAATVMAPKPVQAPGFKYDEIAPYMPKAGEKEK